MKSRKQRLIGLAVGVVLLVVGWYKVVWTGQTTAIAAEHVKQATAEAAARKSKAEANRLETVKTDPLRAKLVQKLDAAVPAEPGLPEYIRWIHSTADDHQLVIPTISHSSPVAASAGGPAPAAGAAAANDLFQISLAMQATGTYEDILSFVHTLETADRLIVLDSLSISPGSGGAGTAAAVDQPGSPVPGAGAMTASITARMFAQHGLASTDSTVPPASPATTPAASAGSVESGASTPTTTASTPGGTNK